MLMMLSSADNDRDVHRSRELGIAGFLRKPITPSELQDAVLHALGHRLSRKATQSTSKKDAKLPSCPLNILLVEDNPLNQRVTMGILKKRGHDLVAVNNGYEALDSLVCLEFDLVLMDVQMPEMDGIEATIAIRQKEQQTGEHIPIIAMTAHAMKGDRERCMRAGMDDYIAKPVEPAVLVEMISKWAPHKQLREQSREATALAAGKHLASATNLLATDSAPGGTSVASVEVFDMQALTARVEGDLDLLAEMIDLHSSSSPQLLAEIVSAVSHRHRENLVRASHTLKGVLKSMCATRCAQAVLQLENIGNSGDFDAADEALVALRSEFEKLQIALEIVAEEIAEEVHS